MHIPKFKLIPKTNYSDYYEISRFELTYKINLFMGIALPVLAITFYILDQPAMVPTAIGAIFNFGMLISMFRTKNYKFSAFLFGAIGIILSIYTLLSFQQVYHFVDPLWMLIITIYIYFTLGKIWGNISMLIQFGAIAYYLTFNLNTNLSHNLFLTEPEVYAIVINSIFCGALLAYLISQFIKRTDFALQQYKNLTTELTDKNLVVEKQNREKTAMLKEIHHRVKNNLQVITSLLRLQSREIENKNTVMHFNQAMDRIAAIALIHNKMYQEDDLNEINIKSYLESLSLDLIRSYEIEIEINLDIVVKINRIVSDSLIPIALIFNELISNSLKHAFKAHSNGKISIRIEEYEQNKLELIYTDNGVWQKPQKPDSFGLELIETLVEQLNGTLERTTQIGTRYKFKLDINS